MNQIIRLAVLGALLATVAATGAATAEAKVTVGIGDNKPSMFGDQRFRDLDVPWVRNIVPWDALRNRDQRSLLDAWMGGARAVDANVLIAFEQSRRGRRNPTPQQLKTQLRALLKRYPGQIRAVTTWNEPNINAKSKPARRVAQWYRSLRQVTRPKAIKLIAADVVDRDNMASWTTLYLQELRRQGVPRPKHWGLHNYVDVNNLSYARTRRFTKLVKGQVWLTETGGVAARNNGSTVRFKGRGAAFQARATKYLLSTMLRHNRSISHVFIYNWNAQHPMNVATWDSALIAMNGRARPAFDVVKRYIDRSRPAP
ncbi:MAG TPA: glycosyl hydrolase [Baekduia sp.]|nr:glycosyl hydrolase [Baekduia sp.]